MGQQTTFRGKQAIVIGASMAGLLAARALANHYEQVTLLERDSFPEPGENRKGVPQGKHAHALLARGLQIMEAHFPGLTDHLISLGADYGDVSALARYYMEGHLHKPTISGVKAICISRPRLEAEVRQRVLALPNVEVVTQCDVLGLLTTPDKRRVNGVRLIRRQPGSAEESLAADLVVDASGRGSRSPAWLESLGYERPSEDNIKINITYTSCYYRRRPEHIPGVNAVVVDDFRRAGAMISQEGNRWIVTLGGYLGEQATPTHAGILEYARNLNPPIIYHTLKDAEPLGEPTTYKTPSNLRRRYERLPRFPTGYLVMGDALCSFNPIHTQGMSVAAMESMALDDCLRQGEGKLATRFFKQAAKIVDVAWSLAAESDLRIPEVEGPRSPMLRLSNWYVSKLNQAAQHDAAVSVAFLKVVNLVAMPESLLHPRIVWRVLRGNLSIPSPKMSPIPSPGQSPDDAITTNPLP
ncbi:MAG: FAD-dependent monooxygenase [Anaerolineae bacterium]|nr:FAD-dependent monooxygenase [Anaerolineae bacterium]